MPSALPSPTSASWGLPATSCAAQGPIHPPLWWACTMELPPPSALDSSVSPTLDLSCSPQQRVWEGEQIEQRESLLHPHNHGDPLLSSPAPFLVPRPLPESFSSAFGTLRSATTHLALVLLPSPPPLLALTHHGWGWGLGAVLAVRCSALCSSCEWCEPRPAAPGPGSAPRGHVGQSAAVTADRDVPAVPTSARAPPFPSAL